MKRWLLTLIVVVCLGSFAVKMGRVAEPFVDRHGWVSAHFSIMARNYVDHGFWQLRLAPVQSTGPLEPRPDYYFHWPFLFQIVLAVWFKLGLWTHGWGVTELGGRLFASLISTGTIAAVAAASWRAGQPGVAVVAAVMVGFLPVELYYGAAVIHLVLATALWSAAVQELVAVVRGARSDRLFLLWAGLAMLTSWEPCLGAVAPGALWLAYRTPVLKRTAIRTALLAGAVVTGLLLFVLAVDPASVRDTLDVALWRAGLSTARPQDWFPVDRPGILDSFAFVAQTYLIPEVGWRALALGSLGAVVLGARAVRRTLPVETAASIVGFLTPAVLWYVLMPRHARYHDYELLVAAPLLASLMAWGVVGTGAWLTRATPWPRLPALVPVLALVVFAALRWPAAYHSMRESSHPGSMLFGRALAQETAPSDRLITDIPDQTVDYYADRRIYHLARCDAATLQRVIAELTGGLKDASILFATWPERADGGRSCAGLLDMMGPGIVGHESGGVRFFELRRPESSSP